MENEIKIGERIAELMLDREINNTKLAKEMGVNKTTVGTWVRNTKFMGLSQII